MGAVFTLVSRGDVRVASGWVRDRSGAFLCRRDSFHPLKGTSITDISVPTGQFGETFLDIILYPPAAFLTDGDNVPKKAATPRCTVPHKVFWGGYSGERGTDSASNIIQQP